MRADFQPAVRHLSPRALTVIPVCAVALFIKNIDTDQFTCLFYKARLNVI
jgi:hypothetical protein